eukprot:8284313-Pyramimonas_sp.AAC.2
MGLPSTHMVVGEPRSPLGLNKPRPAWGHPLTTRPQGQGEHFSGINRLRSYETGVALCVPLYYILDKKASLEEKALSELYGGYEAYTQQVGRLFPWPVVKKNAEATLTSLYQLLNKPPPDTDEKTK